MKFFKYFLTTALLLCSIDAYSAKKPQKMSNRMLIQKVNTRISARKQRLSETKLLKFMISPALPKVTEEVTAFIQPLTGFTDSEILLQISLNGQLLSNTEQPATELWVADFGTFSQAKNHTVSVKIFLRDKNAAKLITDAIIVLDTEIAALNTQIENEIDPEVIAQLTALRDDKLAQRTELITTLASLQSQIGEESHQFYVQENNTLPGYPQIFELLPNVVKVNEQRNIQIIGTNFDNLTSVKIGGVDAVINSFNSGSIQATFPGLNLGAHDLEIQTTENGTVRNTVMKNAVFSSSMDFGNPNVPPVAVVQPESLTISFGAGGELFSAGSFDPNDKPIHFQWRYISVPPQSDIIPGDITSGSSVFELYPRVPGLYVVALRVAQSVSPFLFADAFAVVKMSEPANRASAVFAPAIHVLTNQTGTSSVSSADPDWWQGYSLMIARQSALGTASLVNGILTFMAGSQAGSDTITVLRLDNGSPPLAGTYDVPVSVAADNQPPVINSLTAKTVIQTLPAMVRFRVGASDADGANDIVSIQLDTGDGITELIPVSGTVAGEVNHNYQSYGPKVATLTVKDKFGATTTRQFNINVNDTDLPTAKFQLSSYSCEVPCTISTDASSSSDAQGIQNYLWSWGDGSPEEDGGVTASHTYNSAGSYFIRLRTQDPQSAEGEGWAQIWVGVQAPANGPSTWGVVVASPIREVQANVPVFFDGGHSFDPLTGGNVSSYSWRRNGSCLASDSNCIATGQTASFFFPGVGNFFPRLISTNNLGRSTTSANTEVIVVNSGHAPRALFTINQIVRPQTISGTAPFLVSLDSSLSYDYDGSIVSRSWDFGDGTIGSQLVENKVYANAGVYFVFLAVTDNDGNRPGRSQMIIVNPPGKKTLKSKPRSGPANENEQYLIQACGKDDGEACYQLAQIYLNQGNTFVYEQLLARACALEYIPACSKKSGARK